MKLTKYHWLIALSAGKLVPQKYISPWHVMFTMSCNITIKQSSWRRNYPESHGSSARCKKVNRIKLTDTRIPVLWLIVNKSCCPVIKHANWHVFLPVIEAHLSNISIWVCLITMHRGALHIRCSSIMNPHSLPHLPYRFLFNSLMLWCSPLHMALSRDRLDCCLASVNNRL